jgi:3D (Asp-Asp-Asp) domain-containing protein
MSTHIRTWGIALVAIGVFAIPTLVTQAEVVPTSPTVVASPVSTPAFAADPISIVKTLHLKVTAYTSEVDETDDTPNITANGSQVHDGIVATNLLPFGTKVMIPSLFGNKVFTVEDRMNKRMANNIDVWMNDKLSAITFGAHTAEIAVLGAASDTSLSLE